MSRDNPPSAADQWRAYIEDRETLLLAPEPRHRYLLSLVEKAKRQGTPREQICEMLEITDAALLWARESLI